MRFFASALTMLIITLSQPVKADEQAILDDVVWLNAHAEIDTIVHKARYECSRLDPKEFQEFITSRFGAEYPFESYDCTPHGMQWFQEQDAEYQNHLVYEALWDLDRDIAHRFKNPIASRCANKPASLNKTIKHLQQIDHDTANAYYYRDIREHRAKELHKCVDDYQGMVLNFHRIKEDQLNPFDLGKE